MCPIVPTLQCGFFRSNFAFAMLVRPRVREKPRSGIEPPTSSLPRTCSSRLSYLGVRLLFDQSLLPIFTHSSHFSLISDFNLPTRPPPGAVSLCGAGNGIRTRDPQLGRLML